MEKTYIKHQNKYGLKVGDKVRALRKAEGEYVFWVSDMDAFVGKTGEIRGKNGGGDFEVFCEGLKSRYWFPYFVLEKVEESETPKQPEPMKSKEKKLTSYSVFTVYDRGKDFFFITATSKKETSESIIFTEESGGVWEFYKKHIVAIKTA